jgi:hypothetical protein
VTPAQSNAAAFPASLIASAILSVNANGARVMTASCLCCAACRCQVNCDSKLQKPQCIGGTQEALQWLLADLASRQGQAFFVAPELDEEAAPAAVAVPVAVAVAETVAVATVEASIDDTAVARSCSDAAVGGADAAASGGDSGDGGGRASGAAIDDVGVVNSAGRM